MTEDWVLPEMPKVGPLLLRALAPSRRASGEPVVPRAALVVEGHRQDVARHAAYARVCGFTLRDEVSPTWLHVLTFPLQMATMARPDFPFPLAKVLHASNHMELLRPARLDEVVDLRAECTRMAPHRKGIAFDLTAQVHVAGEPVWRGVSTYLASGSMPGESEEGLRLEAPDAPLAQQWQVPADMGKQYAAVSGDANPIHTSRLIARAMGFRRPIVHGMWTHARALAALEGRLPETYAVDVQFAKPISLPARVRFGAVEADEATSFVVANSDGSKPYMIGRTGAL